MMKITIRPQSQKADLSTSISTQDLSSIHRPLTPYNKAETKTSNEKMFLNELFDNPYDNGGYMQDNLTTRNYPSTFQDKENVTFRDQLRKKRKSATGKGSFDFHTGYGFQNESPAPLNKKFQEKIQKDVSHQENILSLNYEHDFRSPRK